VSECQDKLDVGISTYFEWMAAHPEVAVRTVEIHTAGRRALERVTARLGIVAERTRG